MGLVLWARLWRVLPWCDEKDTSLFDGSAIEACYWAIDFNESGQVLPYKLDRSISKALTFQYIVYSKRGLPLVPAKYKVLLPLSQNSESRMRH